MILPKPLVISRRQDFSAPEYFMTTLRAIDVVTLVELHQHHAM
jgi:hypothetical protein